MAHITAAAIATVAAAVALLAGPAPAATAAPTCMPGDELRQGYQCSPAAGWGITPGRDCIRVWTAYPSPMRLETICRGPR